MASERLDIVSPSCASGQADEPTPTEHARSIAAGAAAAAVGYGVCRLAVPSSRAEDIVDLVHSLGTSGVATYGIANMRPHPVHFRSLPPNLASGSGLVVRMFNFSMGYFSADLMLIFVDVVFRKKFPHLWAGRLAHHCIQLLANSYCTFGKGQRADIMLANRTVLCHAYLAELSSVFLRLSNMARKGSVRTRRAINWMLVVTFFGSRILNFPWAIAMYWRCRDIAPPLMFRTYILVTSSGYALSMLWFLKILRIALQTGADSVRISSVEC